MKRLTGLAACLGIITVVLGAPTVLLAIGAQPLPSGLSWSEVWSRLMAPDDGTLIRALFALLAWAAWVYFTLAILLEIVSRIRGIRAPRLPGFRPSQLLAQSLVGAAALLFVAAPLTANAQPHAPSPPPTASHSSTQAGPAATPPSTATAPTGARGAAKHSESDSKQETTRTHTVRSGESLSSIAEQQLGDAHRWGEIARLNYGRAQPDGHELTRSHVIQPGWRLRLPAGKPAASVHGNTHRVERGESLWSIAEDDLGSGERYPEILRASRAIHQPGGVRITDPDLIEPGWIVRIPGAPTKTHTSNPQHPASHSARTDSRTTAPAQHNEPQPPATQPTTAPAGPPTSASTQAPGDTSPAPTTDAAPSDTGPIDPGVNDTRSSSASDDDGLNAALPVATAAGVGTLLAAGVITLVTHRRRQQQRRRRPGRRLPMPSPDVAHTEQQLRAAADPLSVEVVDAALRGLARSCAESGQPLPTVRAARLKGDQFDLYLDEPATLPAPWAGTADATVWTLPADHADQVDTDLTEVPAPFPALVTVGHDLEEGHVFLDLEYLTSLGLIGNPDLGEQVLAALAIELATSRWADDLQVTIVGGFPELEDALQTGRIRYLPSIGRVLDELSSRAAADRTALADADVSDLNHARTTRQAPDAWTPEIVLIAGALTPRQQVQLEQLADEMPRVAIATITNEARVGEWALVLDATGESAVLEPIGLTLRPQRIDPDSYAAILELVATATDEEDVANPTDRELLDIDAVPDISEVMAEPTAVTELVRAAAPSVGPTADAYETHDDPSSLAQAAAVRGGHEDEDGAPTGQAAVAEPSATAEEVPDTQPPARDRDDEVSAEAVALAPAALDVPAPAAGSSRTSDLEPATHPVACRPPRICVLGPVTMEHAAGTVEPSKKTRLLEYGAYLALNGDATPAAIDDAIWPSRTNEDNLNTRNTATSKLRAWLGKDAAGEPYLPRFSYAFADALTTDWHQWQQLVGPGPARASTTRLEEALSLVRGRPFEGTHLRRYAWAEPLKQEMISAIADVAYELAHRRLMDGRWRAADETAALALRIEPGLERMWRIRILAAHEAHNRAAETEAIDRMLLTIDELGFDLEPETTELLEALRDSTEPHFDKLLGKAL